MCVSVSFFFIYLTYFTSSNLHHAKMYSFYLDLFIDRILSCVHFLCNICSGESYARKAMRMKICEFNAIRMPMCVCVCIQMGLKNQVNILSPTLLLSTPHAFYFQFSCMHTPAHTYTHIYTHFNDIHTFNEPSQHSGILKRNKKMNEKRVKECHWGAKYAMLTISPCVCWTFYLAHPLWWHYKSKQTSSSSKYFCM